jgi:NAD+ synthase (glutamine-hydrolysing)
MLRIALAQINSCVGDINGNLAKIVGLISQAKQQNADLVVFPELALTGYPPEDLLLKSSFIDNNLKALETIRKAAAGIICLVGFVNRKQNRIYNACAVIQNGKIKDIYHKINLPNYSVFDEKRYFTCGDALSFCSYKNYKFTVNICEDIWRKGYVELLKNRGIDFVVNISASPFSAGKTKLREQIITNASQNVNAAVFYCNACGGQDELVFDGTSMVVADGEVVAYGKRFSEDLLFFDWDKTKRYKPVKFSFSPEEELFNAVCLGLKDYVIKNKFDKVIIGISGGIDSAVVAVIAAAALGKDKVIGLLMPSQYTSRETFIDAKKVCANLGIAYNISSIDNILDVYREQLEPVFNDIKINQTEENIQARIRGNLLMAFSNRYGYLVLNTGNKSEVSCGYCTLYGDMVGGFGVLKDVTKDKVYAIAKYINKIKGKKVIPVSVINRAPSAELKPNQKDSDTLPAYDLLDPVLKLYIEENYSLEQIVSRGYSLELVKKIIRMVDRNEYKRRQAPIGVKLTACAFGKDRRMPITNGFR